jgi:hypothetical protein
MRPFQSRCLIKSTVRGFIGVAAFSCILSLAPTSSAAQDENPTVTIKVRVEAKPQPTKAIGLLLSTTGASQIAETSLHKVGDKLYDVIFTVPRNSLQDDSVATAMAISAGGDITFANVTPALLSDAKTSVANIPECPSEDTTNLATINQLAPLKALVDIRVDRAELAQRKMQRSLTTETLEKLKRFERAFGLAQTEELSLSLSPQDLVDRLARINFALKEYQVFKKPPTSGNS